jgi:hypothetical protein
MGFISRFDDKKNQCVNHGFNRILKQSSRGHVLENEFVYLSPEYEIWEPLYKETILTRFIGSAMYRGETTVL